MARGAGQLAGALEEASRLTQPVGRAHDFEIVLVPAARRAIEIDLKAAERLAGPIGERSSTIALDRMRQLLAGGLEVALHAHLQLAFGAQPRRIDDRSAYGSDRRARCPRRANVVAPRPVAPLAIDPFGQGALIHGLTARLVV